MALTPQRSWARVPSTHPSDRAAALGDIPPPCSRMAQCGKRNVPLGSLTASCSPVGGKGRLVQSTLLMVLAGETVEAPVPMHAHNRASTPSRGGREGIEGSSMSRRSEGIWRIPSFLYYSYHKKRKNTPKPSTSRVGQFYCFFKRANDGNAASPPLMFLGILCWNPKGRVHT